MKFTKEQKRKILKGMRSRLERPGGWVQNVFTDRSKEDTRGYPSFCLAGAANDAAKEIGIFDGYGDQDAVVKALSIDALAAAKLGAKAQAEVEESGEVATYTFNDRSKTRKKDVLALVDEKLAELS
jgi:hypothetical protein